NYEFCIDTGSAKPVACKPPQYGIHKSSIINSQLQHLLKVGWISKFPCLSGWLSMIVLAPKPHQEHISDIDDFIWRLCVSYRGLNSVTLVYSFPIPRCDEAIDNFAPGAGHLYWISVDCKSGFHQISVRHSDRNKLCFVGPGSILYTFNVMPFGPVNAPACYTVLMFLMRQEWQALFQERFPDLDESLIKTKLIQSGDRQIVDDILLFSNDPFALILYFSCVCHIFTKWRLSFNPKKCDFFLERVEWIGIDLRPDGNSPASSKYDMVHSWPLPSSGVSLHSFVGLLNFYARFIAHFEDKVGPLRTLVRQYHRKPIPPEAWTPPLRSLFDDLKTALVSDPLLRRYDSSLPTFIKTDWSKTAMSFILMQPEDSDAAKAAIALLEA
ncbi:reverse transcriptase family protein, partial [Marinobacter shengliensis]